MSFLILLFAHLLADYPLQGEFLSKMKGQKLILMLTHCGIWTGCICVAARLAGIPVGFGVIVFLFGVHFAADEAKCSAGIRGPYKIFADPLGAALWIDQAIHVGQILVLLGTHAAQG